MDDLYLMHHGIKGMHWGVRRYQNSDGTLTDAGKRRYGIQDARKYYKINRLQRAKENTKNANRQARLTEELRRTQTRSDRKKALLNQKDINAGRQIVASNRMRMAMAGTIAKGAATTAGVAVLASNPRTRWAAPLAAVGGAALTATSAKKVPYYTMENHRYKQANASNKNAKTHGESKLNKRLRSAAKVAGTTAAIAGGGYLAYKVGGKVAENKIYDSASATAKKAMDAAKDYKLGEKARKATDIAGRAIVKGAKRAYGYATSEETKAKVKAAGKAVKDFATSEETKQKARTIAKKTKKAAKRTATAAQNVYRGYTGRRDDEDEERRNQNRRR